MRELILKACFSVLVPVARSLLARGIGYMDFRKVAKAAFVHVALEDYGVRGRPTNLSRLSEITGLSRREVRLVRGSLGSYEYDRRGELSPLSDLLHRWFTDSKYQDDGGKPVVLRESGANPSFESLAKECGANLPVEAIRDALLKSRAIEALPGGVLVARRRQVVPSDSDQKLVTAYSFGLNALATTIEFNARPERTGEGRIERFVESNPAPGEKRDMLRIALRKRIVEFSESVDNMFGTETTPNNHDGSRVGVGVFYYEDSN